MLHQKNLLLLVTACLLLFPLLLAAQNDTVKLEELEIIGIRPDISTTTHDPVQVIKRNNLDALPTTTVGDVVRNFSGITLKDYGGVGDCNDKKPRLKPYCRVCGWPA